MSSQFSAGTITLVTGYTGIVGGGVVEHLLANTDTTVVAVVRRGSRESPNNSGMDKVYPICVFIPEDGSMDGLSDRIQRATGGRQIDHVVSIFGGKAPRKPLSMFEDADVMASAKRSLPHLRLLRALPMTPRVSYTFVTGMLGERCFMPDKLTGMTLSNALLYGMIVAFRAELAAAGKSAVRVRELRIGSMLHRPDQDGAGGREGHPAIPASSDAATAMQSFSSGLVGKFLVDAIERDAPEDLIRLGDDAFRET